MRYLNHEILLSCKFHIVELIVSFRDQQLRRFDNSITDRRTNPLIDMQGFSLENHKILGKDNTNPPWLAYSATEVLPSRTQLI